MKQAPLKALERDVLSYVKMYTGWTLDGHRYVSRAEIARSIRSGAVASALMSQVLDVLRARAFVEITPRGVTITQQGKEALPELA